MIIDYNGMSKLIDIRMRQIDDVSKEVPYYNKEYIELTKIRKSLGELILLSRIDWQDYDNQILPRIVKEDVSDASDG